MGAIETIETIEIIEGERLSGKGRPGTPNRALTALIENGKSGIIGGMGLLDNLVGVLSGANDPKTAKKKRLRQLVKDLGKNRYSRFYHARTGELEDSFAKFLYDIYKVTASAQVFLQNAAASAELRAITVEAFLNKDLKALNDKLSAAAIQRKAAAVPVKDLGAMVKRDLAAFVSAFDNTRVNGIDACYNAVIALVRFVSFDFYFVLKKFDPGMAERSFTRAPRFQGLAASEITEELKDFMEFSAAIEEDRDWKSALSVLKTYKEGMDVVNSDQWTKVIRLLKDVGRSRILELVLQFTLRDPLWQSVPRVSGERVADSFLDAKKAEIEGAINKIQHDKRGAQINQLAQTVFGSAEVERLANYTNKGNELLLKKNFEGFTKIDAMNYLKAYMLDFFKKEVRELCDLLLIRGQWTSNVLSQPVSDAYHEMMDISERIVAFDEALADSGEHGGRLKQALVKVDRDKGQGKYIRIILGTVNNTAQRMINSASSSLITIGRNFKSLLEDMQKKPAELIMNWHELGSASEQPLSRRIAEDYKRMYYFVQLLQFYTGPVEEQS
ncbi:MAG: DUF5312 family protein [Treponema sp.]|jgi:hypothetical protein|nr:DUF5312 family protein [Treponema sp.]